MSLEQHLLDWLKKTWLRDHPEDTLPKEWGHLAARDLAAHIRRHYDLKAR